MQRHTVQSDPSRGPRALLLGACALLLVLGRMGSAMAQLPPGQPVLIYSDDFNASTNSDPPNGWSDFNWDFVDGDRGRLGARHQFDRLRTGQVVAASDP